MHHYHAFGLGLESDLALPELHRGGGPVDVSIRLSRGAVARPAAAARIDGSGARVVLYLEDMIFTITAGRTIDIVAPPGRSEADIRLWLLGSVMATLLHQRGIFSLHANVVALPGGGAAAFAGPSGAGKSTLAALLDRAGMRVLGDDLCAVRFDGGRPLVAAGIPRLKLWGETLALLERSAVGLEPVASDLAKYHVPLGEAEEALAPMGLERIYLLGVAAGPGEPLITRIGGAAAAAAVLDNVFRWGVGQTVGGTGSRGQFDQAMAIARQAAVFRLARRWGADQLAGEVAAVAAHLSSPLTNSEAASTGTS